ncbi:high-affinity zinc uptake system membrane protein ZnuB [Thiosulfatimonas sediminis]|uniref:High-affinity zinc uptake system membrane protein ZnuB n=1 Tax=Thiosulfatimonas sediminis TaxID=2675054 RepID=A0A6F8PWX2_9GAMM|nr:iron chelate uptake ABC transporter family permease subunit [Thiosulfatimonas sediminis]BBP46537.1 high-affinity zinc uptake system membrane protein ZnuB [Thiosulfatimonas sediminis]
MDNTIDLINHFLLNEIGLNALGFLGMALLGGIGLALISAPLGVFVVWQRQSYFGATLAHSALLGVSIALLLQTNLSLTIIVVSLLIAWGIYSLSHTKQLSSDTLLGILAHSSLALGLILISLQDSVQIDLMSYLFGDILSINAFDILLIVAIGLLIALFYQRHWRDLLNITLNAELAHVEGTQVKKIQLQFVLLLALMIALSMKIVGVLLITSLLIIPAAAARRLAQTPEQMLGWSLILGMIAVLLGIGASYQWDLPTGPAIVMAATLLFLALLSKKPR